MNDAQELWWRQARSDHALFVRLRRIGAEECHLLHYLQMATEKLSKAYLCAQATLLQRVTPGSFAS